MNGHNRFFFRLKINFVFYLNNPTTEQSSESHIHTHWAIFMEKVVKPKQNQKQKKD